MADVPSDLVPNWPWGGPSCTHCGDDGQVLVATRPPGFEEMAPCPHCVKGYRIEFGFGVKKNQREEVIDAWHQNPGGGPWGRDGFWRGRDPALYGVT